MDGKISTEFMNFLCERFQVAIDDLRDYDRFEDLYLEDGWVIKSDKDVVFIINPDKNEDIPANVNLKGKGINSGKYGQILREAIDAAYDLDKYSELTAKVKGLTLDPNTGKIAFKLI